MKLSVTFLSFSLAFTSFSAFSKYVRIESWMGNNVLQAAPFCGAAVGQIIDYRRVCSNYTYTHKSGSSLTVPSARFWLGNYVLAQSSDSGVYGVLASVSDVGGCSENEEDVNGYCVPVSASDYCSSQAILDLLKIEKDKCFVSGGYFTFTCNSDTETFTANCSTSPPLECNIFHPAWPDCAAPDIPDIDFPDFDPDLPLVPELPDDFPELPDFNETPDDVPLPSAVITALVDFHRSGNKNWSKINNNLSTIKNTFDRTSKQDNKNFSLLMKNNAKNATFISDSNSSILTKGFNTLNQNINSSNDYLFSLNDLLASNTVAVSSGTDSLVSGLNSVVSAIKDVSIPSPVPPLVTVTEYKVPPLYSEEDLLLVSAQTEELKKEYTSSFLEFRESLVFDFSLSSGSFSDPSFILNVAGSDVEIKYHPLFVLIDNAYIIYAVVFFCFGFLGIRSIVGVL